MSFEPRRECPRCGRPVVTCYCGHVQRLQTRTKLLVLQHPREHGKAVGTARMAALCLESAEVVVGVDFAQDPRVQALLGDPARPAVLLYPGPDAKDLAREPPSGPVTLVVVDGTWHQARSLTRKNPFLLDLPQYAFEPERPSEYRIRREPRADYVSTIEAVTAALGLLEGDSQRFESMLLPFRAMVDKQLDYVAQSSGGRRRKRRRVHAEGPSRLPSTLFGPNVICVSGEANAWPHDRALGGAPYPHELVHWTAHRMCDGTRFEALIKPRLPLSPSPEKHSKIDPALLAAGLSFQAFDQAWQAFCPPDAVICAWGHYGTGLLRREGGTLPEPFVDMRKVSGDFLRRRPGSAEDLVKHLGLAFTPCGSGRAGERLGMLLSITEYLLITSRSERMHKLEPDGSEAETDAES